MRLLILALCLSISTSFAGLEILEVHDVDLTYVNPEGQGKIGKFKFGVDTGDSVASEKGDFLQDIFLKVIGNDIFLESDFSYIVWRNAPDFFTDAHKIIARKLELYFTLPRNSLSAQKLQYDFSQAKFQLFDLDARCSESQRIGGLAQRLLNNCMFNGSLKLSKLEFKFPKEVVQEVVETTYPEEISFKIDTVYDVNMTIQKGLLNFTAVVDWVIDLRTTITGKLTPLIDQQKLQLDVDKIYLGKINVTKLTLFVLKKANISGLEIDGNIIKISF